MMDIINQTTTQICEEHMDFDSSCLQQAYQSCPEANISHQCSLFPKSYILSIQPLFPNVLCELGTKRQRYIF